jgi:hypothetical protein
MLCTICPPPSPTPICCFAIQFFLERGERSINPAGKTQIVFYPPGYTVFRMEKNAILETEAQFYNLDSTSQFKVSKVVVFIFFK